MKAPNLILYTRPNCPLCEEAREAVEAIAARVSFAFQERDITADLALYERYRERVPVIAVDGVDALGPPVTVERLLAVLGRAGG